MIYPIFVLFSLVSVLGASNDAAQYIEENAVFFRNLDISSSNSDLNPLFSDPLLQNAAIIGLGDNYQGSSELTTYRTKMIRFMIETMNVRTVSFENQWLSSTMLNDFVNGLVSDLDAAMRLPKDFKFNTDEMRELMLFIRRWNDKHSTDSNDCPVTIDAFDIATNPNMAMQSVINYLVYIDAAKASQVTKLYSCLYPYTVGTGKANTMSYRNIQNRAACQANIANAAQIVAATAPELSALPGDESPSLTQDEANRAANLVIQAEDYLYNGADSNIRMKGIANNIVNGVYATTQARCSALKKTNAKVVVWSTNYHVATIRKSTPGYGPIQSVGGYVQDLLTTMNLQPTQYVAIGSSIYSGNAYNLNAAGVPDIIALPTGMVSSFEEIIHTSRTTNNDILDNFIIKSGDKSDPQSAFLTQSTLNTIIGTAVNGAVGDIFNFVFYVDIASPAHQLCGTSDGTTRLTCTRSSVFSTACDSMVQFKQVNGVCAPCAENVLDIPILPISNAYLTIWTITFIAIAVAALGMLGKSYQMCSKSNNSLRIDSRREPLLE